ncbi:MAG: hypothetical protein IJ868_00465 [Prevotella sp.]|nr:hypothetical protein [Prevotella sp.]
MIKTPTHKLLASLLMLVLTAGLTLTACTGIDDNPTVPADSQKPVLTPGALDVVNGRLYKMIRVDSLDNYRLPVSALTDVDVTVTHASDYFGARLEKAADGQQYVTLYQKKPMTNGLSLAAIRVSPKGDASQSRSVVFVFRDPSLPVVDDDGEVIMNAQAARTRAASEGVPTSVYSQIIGHGTNSFGDFGNRQSVIFAYDAYKDLSQKYFEVYEQAGEGTSFVIQQNDYTKTSQDLTATLGINFKHTKGPKVAGVPTGLTQWALGFLSAPARPAWTGTINLGITGSQQNVNDYEYCMSHYQVKKGDARIYMDKFDFINNNITQSKWTTLMSLVDEDFVDEVCYTSPKSFNPEGFFQEWGTDIITQGTFGGTYDYLFARRHNIYESDIKTDALVQLKRTKGTWMNALFGIPADGFTIDGTATYARDDYHELSGSWESVTYRGGADSFESPEKWAAGFSNTDNWRLISYRLADESSYTVAGYDYDADESNYTYPVELLATQLVVGYLKMKEKLGETLTTADSAAVERAMTCINMLYQAKDDYLMANGQAVGDPGRILLADIQFVKGGWNHDTGEAIGPRVLTDPWGTKRIYYPMMENDNALCYRGYPLDVAQSAYLVAKKTDQTKYESYQSKWRDLYIYYALDTENNCPGLVDITSIVDGSYMDSHYHQLNYQKSGETAFTSDDNLDASNVAGFFGKDEGGWTLGIKKYDPEKNKPEDKITAVAVYCQTESDGINGNLNTKLVRGSTGGSELPPYPTATQKQRFNDFWASGKWTAGLTPNGYPCLLCNTATLHITDLSEITQPKQWESNKTNQ